MLDADAVAEYEEWKLHKMTIQADLSVGAFNAEMESQALAYEQGVRDGLKRVLASTPEKAAAIAEIEANVIEDNLYRKPGMRGERVVAHIPSSRPRRTVSYPAPLPLTDEDED